MSICPDEKELLYLGQLDAAAVNYMIEIIQLIQTRMVEKSTLKLVERNAYALFGGGPCPCGETTFCKLNICDLIEIINKNGFRQIFSDNFTYTLKPYAFAVTDDNTFIPIADPVFGGLVANPSFYNFDQFPTVYQKVRENPFGMFVNFVKYHEGNRECVVPERCYARILPKCFKKYGTIVLMIEFKVLSSQPTTTTIIRN